MKETKHTGIMKISDGPFLAESFGFELMCFVFLTPDNGNCCSVLIFSKELSYDEDGFRILIVVSAIHTNMLGTF